jgi:dethiobiotin synthetase/adenosylmethionine--8-amino-7-oxononanoate aminotransferase
MPACQQAAAQQAQQVLWWPFTQHGTVAGDEAVTVIDSRAGERFAVWRPQQGAAGGWRGSEMQLQYDACASWWTQVGKHD